MGFDNLNSYLGAQPARAFALDLLKRIAAEGAVTLRPGEKPFSRIRIHDALQSMITDGVALATRSNAESVGFQLTDKGVSICKGIAGGGIALLPAAGGIKVKKRPERRKGPARTNVGTGRRLPRKALTWLLAAAPDHYDADVVQGSETWVLLDPLERWEDHPAFIERTRDCGQVSLAWEVFDPDGESFGLVLRTTDRFYGIDAFGEVGCEDTLAAIAWQIRINR
jgi:hypothetical protein